MSQLSDPQAAQDFQIQLSVFSGPLELLLHLIEKEDLDITTVSLVQVADQYLGYLRSGERLDPDALAEFIAIGARLAYLKSRALLPRTPPEEDRAAEELGEDLAQLLREYKRFREAADELREREAAGLRSYPRLAPPPDVPLAPGLDDVSLEQLARLLQEALLRRPEEEPVMRMERDPITMADPISAILESLRRFGRVSFLALVQAARSRTEIVVTFMALLELLKAGQIHAEQAELFGDVVVVPAHAGPLGP